MIRTLTARILLAVAGFTPALVLPAAAQAPKPAAAAHPPAMSVPKDAVANADGTWSYTDKQGKSWTYAKTPFGITRLPVNDATNTAAKTQVPAGLPAGAVRNSDGNYAWTDPNGKKWIFSSTPFGLSKTPAQPVADWKVIDKGDTVRFERPGSPMGPTVWEKKKTELNDEERRAYELSTTTTSQTARPE